MMPFVKPLPHWEAPGIEPPLSLRQNGWKAGVKPPDEYFNHLQNKAYEALKELQEYAVHKDEMDLSGLVTDEDFELHLAEDASITKKGHVQLSDATNSTSTVLAATANAVKKVSDVATGKYTKPTTGIPKIDLDNSVQSSLGKADSALQSVPDASTTAKGIVMLDDAVNSASVTKAATANAVKKVKDSISNVGNYGIATQIEAETGTSDVKYMTPLKVKQAVEKLAPKDVPNGYASLDEEGYVTQPSESTKVVPGETVLFNDYGNYETTSTAWTPKVEYSINVSGVIRFTFNVQFATYNATTQTATAQIYKNGVPFGILRTDSKTLTNGNGAYFTEDLAVKKGDKLQLYSKVSTSGYIGRVGVVTISTAPTQPVVMKAL